MTFKVTNLNVDLMADRVMVTLMEEHSDSVSHISVNVGVKTPGNMPENQLKEIARSAAKKDLEEASKAL